MGNYINITSRNGMLVAEYKDYETGEAIYRSMEDAGLQSVAYFGDTFDIDWVPQDEWELEDMLREKLGVM